MFEVECIECGLVKPATPGPGRPRYYCDDECRQAANSKMNKNPLLIKKYAMKKRNIRVLYKEYRSSSMSIEGLRKIAIRQLSRTGWSNDNIGKLFGITDERVRLLIK